MVMIGKSEVNFLSVIEKNKVLYLNLDTIFTLGITKLLA